MISSEKQQWCFQDESYIRTRERILTATACYEHVLYQRERNNVAMTEIIPRVSQQRICSDKRRVGKNEGRRKTGVTPHRILRERPRAEEAARRKIRGRRRWHCDYAKNLLPAKLRWTDTLEGVSDASYPQLRSYATFARAAPLQLCALLLPSSVPSVVVVHRHVHHRHPVLGYEESRLLSSRYVVRRRETR